MKPNWRFTLVLAVVFGAAWSTTSTLAPRLEGRRFQHAMELVDEDRASLVCAPGDCQPRGAAHTLLVFFSPRDCAIGLYQAAVVDSLYRAVPRGRLAVLGIARGMDAAAARKFVAASGITYPVYANAARFERAYGNPKPADLNAPVLVLLDGRGRVLDTRAAGGSIRAHHHALALLSRFWEGAR